ncbi:penicillin-binding protein activator [Parvularcula dongshanensis]|uniref:ABC-type branched-subunit amino acid transport system substrate-binding protein n=1 Tax=Parvularcula dongshanensis TaxID=1173995 RepID=A0A840HZY9_9PROT|nr:penicillin-binding protein activator [Parvularcula dongshanensis]MBB4657574.1 ABC-type branched-subunit amino acid transport system substrate-binding protein [Parvularcula dongshanensis]
MTRRLGGFRLGTTLLALLALSACQTNPGPRRDPAPVRGGPGDRPVVRPEVDPEVFATVPTQDRDEVVRVALLLPFSSTSDNVETVAQAMLKAAQMVAFESDNARYLLIPKDTKGTAEGAYAVAEEAIREGAEIILGPLFSDCVEAIAPLARASEIPVIAFSSDTAVAGDGVYLLSFPPEDEVARVTDYAIENGYARFGMMSPYTEFGDRVANAFQNEVQERGGELVHTERYERTFDAMAQPARRLSEYAAKVFVPQYVTPPGQQVEDRRPENEDRGFYGADEPFDPYADPYEEGAYGTDPYAQPQASTIGEDGEEVVDPTVGFQAVFLPEQGRYLRALAPWLPTYDVDIREVKLLGVSSWNNPLLTREPALDGGWFAAPDPALAEGFQRRYERAYGENPPRLASLAYDAALLTARLSELPPRERFAPQTIANPNGFLGADGLFRLMPDGTVERGLAILEIRPSGIAVVDPAPRSFVPESGL